VPTGRATGVPVKILAALAPLLLLAFGQPALAGGTWVFQVVHTAEATVANEGQVWTVKFVGPKDAAVVRYQATTGSKQSGDGEKTLAANGTVAIPTHGSVLFTYDRSKCGMTAINHGIEFLVLDPKGRSAAYKLERSEDKKPAKITYMDAKTPMAEKTKGVLKLNQGAESQTGMTTIAILKEEVKD
jgi:hypothetical protein